MHDHDCITKEGFLNTFLERIDKGLIRHNIKNPIFENFCLLIEEEFRNRIPFLTQSIEFDSDNIVVNYIRKTPKELLPITSVVRGFKGLVLKKDYKEELMKGFDYKGLVTNCFNEDNKLFNK